jgi:hypothetical protein
MGSGVPSGFAEAFLQLLLQQSRLLLPISPPTKLDICPQLHFITLG